MSRRWFSLGFIQILVLVPLLASPKGFSVHGPKDFSPSVQATSEQNARFVHCISKKYELVVDLSQSDLGHRLLKNVHFGVRSGPGPFKKEKALWASLRSEGPNLKSEGPNSISEGPNLKSEGPNSISEGPNSILEFVGHRGTRVQITTSNFIFGEALLHDWDLGCDFYQIYDVP